MKVDELLDRLEALVHDARRIPFTAQVTLNEDDVMDIVDQLRGDAEARGLLVGIDAQQAIELAEGEQKVLVDRPAGHELGLQ